MTDPYDTPTGRWALIFYGSGNYQPAHSRQEWAQIADAIHSADLVRRGEPGVRGDDAWCAEATDRYQRLDQARVYWHLGTDDEPVWHADRDLIEAWLQAPVIPAGEEPATMLDANGWQDAFDPARTPDPADLTILVDLAQAAGVVGTPGYKVGLLRWVDNGVFRDDAFLVLLWPPDGPARASSAVSRDLLLTPALSTMDPSIAPATRERSTVDRIVGLLSNVARQANTLMTATDAPGTRPDGSHRPQPQPGPATGSGPGARGHPFRVIDGGLAGNPPALRVVPPTPAPPRSPRT